MCLPVFLPVLSLPYCLQVYCGTTNDCIIRPPQSQSAPHCSLPPGYYYSRRNRVPNRPPSHNRYGRLLSALKLEAPWIVCLAAPDSRQPRIYP
ncbi:hypothetical protein PoMZ_04822 [Pyricularia oryzae]|uniref:Secreted protein n=1 Tax=Pyricularia oryzae TaxID=318829 RepID=A0A4P7NAM0_PYROR|nr:hypothetical protein PoMZ_04822 [Pyricularia oryzae]